MIKKLFYYLILSSSFLLRNGYAQENNLLSIKVKTTNIALSYKPVDMKFSWDENYLFTASKLSENRILISKYSCTTGALINSTAIIIPVFLNFEVSPDQKSLLLKDWKGNLYYVSNYVHDQTPHFVDNQFYEYIYFFVDDNSFYYQVGSLVYGGRKFSVDQWGYQVIDNNDSYNSILSNYSNYAQKYIHDGRFYKLVFDNGLSAYDLNSNDKQIIDQLNNYGSAVHAISINSKRAAYVTTNGLSIKTPYVDNLAKESLYYFQIPNFYHLDEDQKVKISLLLSANRLIANVFTTRYHPITRKPMGPDAYKATLKIIAQRGDIVYARLIKKEGFTTQVYENDFVVGMQSSMGSSDPYDLGYDWFQPSHLKKCSSIPIEKKEGPSDEKPFFTWFDEKFEDNGRGWPIEKSSDHSFSIQNHCYEIISSNVNRLEPVIYTEISSNNDWYIESAFNHISGTTKEGFGLTFAYRDVGNFYTFEISADGHYEICRYLDGQFYYILSWKPSDKILVGNKTNLLKVRYQGGSICEFYINNQLVDRIDNFEAAGPYTGFVIQNTQHVQVKSLIIKEQKDDE